MSRKKRFNSVAEMARNLLDGEHADRLDKRLSERQFIKVLVSLRAGSCMSQEDMASKLGCSQGKISKLECSKDVDIRFGDFLRYATAVKSELRIFVVPKGQTVVDDVKMHAILIKRHLDCLVNLAKKDDAITEGVADFFEEASFNLNRIVKKAAKSLPKPGKKPNTPLQVEVPSMDEGEDLSADASVASRDEATALA